MLSKVEASVLMPLVLGALSCSADVGTTSLALDDDPFFEGVVRCTRDPGDLTHPDPVPPPALSPPADKPGEVAAAVSPRTYLRAALLAEYAQVVLGSESSGRPLGSEAAELLSAAEELLAADPPSKFLEEEYSRAIASLGTLGDDMAMGIRCAPTIGTAVVH